MHSIEQDSHLRVLFLHRHANESNGIGGVMEYLHYLPIFLKKIGIEVLLYREGVSNAAKATGPVHFQNGMPVYGGPFLKPRFFSSSRQLCPLLDLCKHENIQLLHAQGTYRSGYLAMQVYKKTGIPYVVTSHSDIIPSSGRMQKRKTLQYCQQILQRASAVTHLSPRMAELSHQIYPTSEKSEVMLNPVEI